MLTEYIAAQVTLGLGAFFLKMLANLPNLARSAKAGSLIEYTSPARVEPIVLMDRNVSSLPYVQDILYSATFTFAGYYLQAAAIEGTVGDVRVIKLLDKLNPKRSAGDNASVLMHELLGQTGNESLACLPTLTRKKVSLEDDKEKRGNAEPDVVYGNDQFTSASTDNSFYKNSIENANLSVGIALKLEVESKGCRASIPVNIRLITTPVPVRTIIDIVSLAAGNKSIKERFYALKSGTITIQDMWTCQDIIDKERRVRITDKSGAYKEIADRNNSNKLSTIFSLGARPSIATASNIMIISKETADQIELELGGRLSNARIRNKLFQDTLMMIIYVVDARFEMITVYHRTIDLPSEISVKSLKGIGKNKQPDVMEILKAYQQSNAPRF